MTENGTECCELCGSDDNVILASLHLDSGPDDTVDDEAYVCLYCYTKYATNLEMFIEINKVRLELEEEKEEQQDELDF